MSILKALQKKRTEDPNGVVQTPSVNIVPFDRKARRANQPPDLLGPDMKIGNPGSAFIGQPDSLIGTALPDLESDITAGAKLNAEALTRTASKRLPDFVSWTVDAAREYRGGGCRSAGDGRTDRDRGTTPRRNVAPRSGSPIRHTGVGEVN
mgnify:CR=1 FL=1